MANPKEQTRDFYLFSHTLLLPGSLLNNGSDILALGKRAEGFSAIYKETYGPVVVETDEYLSSVNQGTKEQLKFDYILINSLFDKVDIAKLFPELLDHLNFPGEIRIAVNNPESQDSYVDGIPKESKLFPGFFEYDGFHSLRLFLIPVNGPERNFKGLMRYIHRKTPALNAYIVFNSLIRAGAWRRAGINHAGVLAIRNDETPPLFAPVNRKVIEIQQNALMQVEDPQEETKYLGITFKINPKITTPKYNWKHYKINPLTEQSS